MSSADRVPTQVRLVALARMRVAKPNYRTLLAENASYTSPLPHVVEERVRALATQFLALLESEVPTELQALLPPRLPPSRLSPHQSHYAKLCSLCKELSWEKYLLAHRDGLLQHSKQDVVHRDTLTKGKKRPAPPSNTSDDARIFHPERASVTSAIQNHRTERLIRSRYITYIQYAYSAADEVCSIHIE